MARIRVKLKKLAAVALSLAVVVPVGLLGAGMSASAAGPTGAGLAAHAVNAYNEGWVYSYGGSSPGAVDCSGLIASYYGVGGIRSDMMAASPQTGSISSMPDIPGIGLYSPGHVGVYVGGGMAVDARDYGYNLCYQSVSSYRWTNWFYVAGVDYGDSTVVPGPSAGGSSNSGSNSGASAEGSAGEPDDANSVAQEPAAPSYLQLGSTGTDVAVLQTRLAELGYFNDAGTEYFGQYTEECLKAFQQKAGLEPTGIFDEATQLAIVAEDAPSNLPPEYQGGETADEVVSIQAKLIQLQYMAGEATGYYGDETKAAVSAFQSIVGLEESGVFTLDTRAALDSDDAPSNPAAAVLKKGDSGDAVTELQKRLVLLRYMVGDATGTFDEATEAAVKAYQTASGLEVTGEVDKSMKDVIYSNEAIRSPEADNLKLGFTGDDVKALQIKLQKLNFYTGETNGAFDAATEQAVKAFEEGNGLRVTGVAGLAVRISIDAVINSQNLGPTYARGAEPMTVQAAGISTVDEGKTDNDSTMVVLSILFGSLVLFGAVIVFYAKRNPYMVKVVRAKLASFKGSK